MSNQVQPTKEKNITDAIFTKITKMENEGGIVLPKDYSAANALKAAWLVLQQVTTKNAQGQEVLAIDVCTNDSVANAIFEMVVQGLNPIKKQCYFIPYKDKLVCIRSAVGSEAVARRFGGLVKIKAQIVYEGDDFKYEIDNQTGCKRVILHGQKMENIDITKIRGAYAIYETEDGTIDTEIMSKAQILSAHGMGSLNGKSPAHTQFTDQMALKTVRNRACKLLINASSDLAILREGVEDNNTSMLEEANNTVDIKFEEMPDGAIDKPIVVPPQQPTQQPKQKAGKPEETAQPTKEEAIEPTANRPKF